MNEIIKKIGILISIILMFNINNVYAASASVFVSSSSKNIAVNNTITVTVTVSESGGKLGSWGYSISHDSSKLSLIEGSEYMDGEVGDGSITSKSYTLKYKAIANGSTNISVSSASVLDWDTEESLSVNKGNVTINIGNSSNNNSKNLSKDKSSDNNLKSLSIESITLTPEFSKDTLEYNIELNNDVRKIKISAQANDSNANVSGAGEIELNEGQNKIEIIVTAENGSKKTYIINALVKEKNPIDIKVSGKKYTVVRNEIEHPNGFKVIDVKINGEEVKGYYNDIINYTLVALKNEIGDIEFYIYDTKKLTFKKYVPLSSNNINIVIMDVDDNTKIPHRYVKSKFMYNNYEVMGYTLDEKSDFRVIYAVNVETGEKGFYLYDMSEHTIQRFYNDQVNVYVKLIKKCKIAFIILGIYVLISLIIIIILLSKNVKFKTKYLNYKLNKIDNPINNDVKYKDLEGTSIINKIE